MLAEIEALMQPPGDFDARPVVERLVRMAVDAGASDLHLRPDGSRVEVLLRRDGVLQHRFDLDPGSYDRLLVGLKNMARLAAYKKSVPQDGRMEVAEVEVRVATAPTHHGEKAVLRLVRPTVRLLALDELGFRPDELAQLQGLLERPQGLVLACGPAGSGKTTTLYAGLRWLYRRYAERTGARLNIVTLEDPVEAALPELTQTPIQPGMGMTFASGLRSILRQDPEVILVGEIRDRETAEAAVQTGLTGHLVLSTLHTRDSVGVIPRLREMGVAPYLLSAALEGVVFQRLLRRSCPPCEACGGTGYRGRIAVPEILELDEPLRQAILDGAPLAELRRLSGQVPLREACMRRVRDGETTEAEVLRVLG